uniref:Uncharacterized protein n=1 Tax=Strombidium rassoulzadegani TaxID=1082188 RepID=A0A7S3CQN4_9SPIT|mmetsp:Transcript_3790/g.6472  ORF Transcript_3790/g.6472 Transcript_3790/m.6472 type:complete len:201 (+) Transcript_3790:448-1050(+)
MGYKVITVEGQQKNFTEVFFSVNEDMACTLFRSCKKVSLIAQASLQSSISFLDFMGVNGQNQSLSIITFGFDSKLPNVTEGVLPAPMRDDVDRKPLNITMHPCGYEVPANGTVDGYEKIANGTCTFCDEMCPTPDIDSSIGFFDGFDQKKSFLFFGVILGLTILNQTYILFWRKNKVNQEWEMVFRETQEPLQANYNPIL